jgi:hypothetical protein
MTIIIFVSCINRKRVPADIGPGWEGRNGRFWLIAASGHGDRHPSDHRNPRPGHLETHSRDASCASDDPKSASADDFFVSDDVKASPLTLFSWMALQKASALVLVPSATVGGRLHFGRPGPGAPYRKAWAFL